MLLQLSLVKIIKIETKMIKVDWFENYTFSHKALIKKINDKRHCIHSITLSVGPRTQNFYLII
jgi:hypothetical protein